MRVLDDAVTPPWPRFTLFASYEYTLQSADLRLAAEFFDVLVAEYSCGQFVQPMPLGHGHGNVSGGSLVIKDPGQHGPTPYRVIPSASYLDYASFLVLARVKGTVKQ